ncbi:MAG: imidazole glycerol phosphate synthase subunit HisH [Pseudomonadota bacterium]
MQSIAVLDYGMGNLRSVAKAVEHAGAGTVEVHVTNDAAVVSRADRVVFPGQGAMRDAMTALARVGLDELVRRSIGEKPFLGICVGYQALLERSEEDGGTPALGLISGHVRRFPEQHRDPVDGSRLKVPHMGWNRVTQTFAHPLWRAIEDGHRFYFVHSYYPCPSDDAAVSGRTTYGLSFASAAAGDGWFATQFHPEKSAAAGQQLLKNFLSWDGTR